MAKAMDQQTKDKYTKLAIKVVAAAVVVAAIALTLLAIIPPEAEAVESQRPVLSVTERLICDAVDFGDGTIKAVCENEKGEVSGYEMRPFELTMPQPPE